MKPEVAYGEFELRPDYAGPLRGGYDHKPLPNGLVEFKTSVTHTDGTVVPLIQQCPSWYSKCINAEPDYAADDGGSTSAGDSWCESKCNFICKGCDAVPGDGEVEERDLVAFGAGDVDLLEVERSGCTDVCDLISVGSRAATLNIRSLVAAAGAAIAKAACYATCTYLS